MQITLKIENIDRLSNGGPISFTCSDRGFDIGRHEYLDWSLPDPQRVISGKHCEVQFTQGQFILHDVSTNGTFVNDSSRRLDSQHVLKSGDRLLIGDYWISVAIINMAQQASPPDSRGWAEAPISETPTGWPASSQTTPPKWSAPKMPAESVFTSHYPSPSPASMWPSASDGMDGRHAPPSLNPGIGTPTDNVWNQQTYGWGVADASTWDTSADQPGYGQRVPQQADPIDHLADQPILRPSEDPSSVFANYRPAETVQPERASAPDMAVGRQPSATEQPPEPSPMPQPAPREPVDNIHTQAPTSASIRPVQPAPFVSPEPPPVSNPPVPQAYEAPAVSASPDQGKAILKAFAKGANIPESVLAERDPEALAEEIGAFLHLITNDLMSLLQARRQVKAATRNSNLTFISRSGNNALKFSPTAALALQNMLARNAGDNGYLPFDKAVPAAFKDIQKHHLWTYSAMQKAVARLDTTLSPKAIEAEGPVNKGPFGNAKAQLWDRAQERWKLLSGANDDGLVGLFTQYFTDAYEELSNNDPEGSDRGF